MVRSEQVTLKIPRALYDRLKNVIAGTGFRSVTEFAVYVLRDLASSRAASALPKKSRRKPGEHPLTAEEIEAIRRRLRSLGYL